MHTEALVMVATGLSGPLASILFLGRAAHHPTISANYLLGTPRKVCMHAEAKDGGGRTWPALPCREVKRERLAPPACFLTKHITEKEPYGGSLVCVDPTSGDALAGGAASHA
jgi:hypothetical protein